MLVNAENIQILSASYSVAFNTAMETSRPDYQELLGVLLNQYPSTGATNSYPFLMEDATWREWVGERVWGNYLAHMFTVANRKFEKSVAVERDYIDDDSYGLFIPKVQEAGAGWYSLLRRLALNVLLTNPVCVTGKALLATDHKYGDKTIANLVTDAFSRDAFNAALLAANGWKWANDEFMQPTWTHLLVGESNRQTAYDVVSNPLKVVTVEGSGVTAIGNPDQGKVKLMVLPEFTGDQWFLLGSSIPGAAGSSMGMRPVGVQIRRQPVPQNNDARDVELTDLFKWFTSGRAEAFPTLPHLVYGRVAA